MTVNLVSRNVGFVYQIYFLTEIENWLIRQLYYIACLDFSNTFNLVLRNILVLKMDYLEVTGHFKWIKN